MPEDIVRRRIAHWRPELSLAHAIAEECGVSPLAATVRMVELSIDRCAAVLVDNGRVAWAARSASFGAAIERGRPVDARSLAFQCQERAGCDVFGRVPAAVWIGSDAGEHSWMFEQATRIPDLRAVLTLVWAPDHGNRRA